MTDRVQQLWTVLAAYEREEYRLGVSDCVTYATDAWEAKTGVAAPWRDKLGGYTTEEDALACLAALGVDNIGDAFALYIGAHEIAPAFADVGDLIAHLDLDGGVAMGVCVGATFRARGRTRLIDLSMSRALRAFRAVAV
jgi:hypothetical protein